MKASAATAMTKALSPHVRQRGGLSLLHIDAAIRFTSGCIRATRECNENLKLEKINDLKATAQAYVLGTLYTSIAFLEAAINEIFLDAVESIPENARIEKNTSIALENHDVHPYGVVASLAPEVVKHMAQIWLQQERYRDSPILNRLKTHLEQKDPQNRIEMWRTLDKYQLALCLNNKAPFARNQIERQVVDTFVEFRHYLTHAKAEWVTVAAPEGNFVGPEKSTDLEARVKKVIDSAPYQSDTENPYDRFFSDLPFPRNCLSPICARMAVKSNLEFDYLFCERMRIKDIRSRYPGLEQALSAIQL